MRKHSWHTRLAAGARTLFLSMVAVAMASLPGCKPRDPPPVACPALPVRDDGFVDAKIRGGTMHLVLPSYVDAIQTRDCKMVREFYVTFLWSNGRLVPEAQASSKVRKERRLVRIWASGLDDGPEKVAKARVRFSYEAWRTEPALKHDKYPLVFYPRFFWVAPDKPPSTNPPDIYWGIENTLNPVDGNRFGAYCNILRADPLNQYSVVHGDFSPQYPDAKCRGGIIASKDGRILGAKIDVWASDVPEVDKIFNAAASELQTYIQED